jgi:hypothetical protein
MSYGFNSVGEVLEVSTQSKTIEVTPTLDTNAYAAGDRMGSIVTLTNIVRAVGESATIIDIVALDKAKQSIAFDIMFFSASPTVASADNAAIDITDVEMEKCLGVINMPEANYMALANSSICTKPNVGLNITPTTTSAYLLLVAQDAATYAVGSIVLKIKVLQD